LSWHGELQVVLWAGLIGSAEAIGALVRKRFKAFVVVVAALAAGSLLSALQILPTLQLSAAAARACQPGPTQWRRVSSARAGPEPQRNTAPQVKPSGADMGASSSPILCGRESASR
jgi:hypothetical protein